MKRYSIALLAAALALSLLLSGCGAAPSSSPKSASSAAAQESPTADMAVPMAENAVDIPEMGGEAGQVNALADRKVIWESSLVLETTGFDAAIPALVKMVSDAGGYIESQSIDGRSINDGTLSDRSAQINARVPSQKLGEVTASAGALCNILSQTQNAQDITDGYFDTQAHLDTLKIQEERLLEILKKAGTLKDIFELEQELAKVRYEIEALTSSLRRMDSQVTYAYLNMELREVPAYVDAAPAPVNFGQRLSASVAGSWNAVVNSVQGLIIVLVAVLPVLLLWAAIIGAAVFAGLKIWKRVDALKRKKSLPAPTPTEPPEAPEE